MLKTAEASVQAAAQALRAARCVVVTTGAGMSSDSGVPTFRDALTGLWARYDPEELATEAAFRRDPARVFGWYGVEPSPGPSGGPARRLSCPGGAGAARSRA